MVYITRIEHFNAAHKLYNPNWSVEKNDEVFGKCANENWHGHNFELYVTVKGMPDEETGFVYDAKKLSAIIKEHVTEKLDHKNLNVDVDFMKDKICSIEKLMRKPRISFASSNNCFAASLLSYKFFPIPENCAPCPGKIYACFMKTNLEIW